MNIGIHTGMKVDIQILRKGKLITVAKGLKNLFLDNGLKNAFDAAASQMGQWGFYGTSNAPNKRDSSTTTFSRAGSTVTASGNFFEAADVGRLLKFDTGEEVYINTFTNATTVETVTSGAIASSEGTIWYVNQTSLDAYAGEAEDPTPTFTFSAGVASYEWIYDFPTVGGTVNVNEVGFGYSNDQNDINSRVVLSSPTVLLSGDQLRLTATMEMIASPSTPSAYDPTNGSSEEDGTGEAQFEFVSTVEAWNTIWPSNTWDENPNSSGTKTLIPITIDMKPFETYGTGRIFNSSTNIQNLFNAHSNDITNGAKPTTAPFTKTSTLRWSPTRISGTYYGFAMIAKPLVGSSASSTNMSEGGGRFLFLFDNPVTKSGTQAMEISISETMNRTLVN